MSKYVARSILTDWLCVKKSIINQQQSGSAPKARAREHKHILHFNWNQKEVPAATFLEMRENEKPEILCVGLVVQVLVEMTSLWTNLKKSYTAFQIRCLLNDLSLVKPRLRNTIYAG